MVGVGSGEFFLRDNITETPASAVFSPVDTFVIWNGSFINFFLFSDLFEFKRTFCHIGKKIFFFYMTTVFKRARCSGQADLCCIGGETDLFLAGGKFFYCGNVIPRIGNFLTCSAENDTGNKKETESKDKRKCFDISSSYIRFHGAENGIEKNKKEEKKSRKKQ